MINFEVTPPLRPENSTDRCLLALRSALCYRSRTAHPEVEAACGRREEVIAFHRDVSLQANKKAVKFFFKQ